MPSKLLPPSVMLKVEAIHTRIFRVGEPIVVFLEEVFSNFGPPKEKQILCITSKIVSLSENRILKAENINKIDLIRREADVYLTDGPYDVALTIKHGILIPSAGIDESNVEGGGYILYPEDPFRSAQEIYKYLRRRFGLREVGVILTDSHTQPLRRGVVGIALAYWGFQGVKSLVGQKDLFGRELKYTTVHAADALAVTAVFEMGEAQESAPLALITGANVKFTSNVDIREGVIDPENDLYSSLYWRKEY